MKKIILTFGIIAGLIVTSLFYITHGGDMDFDKGQLYGYLSMVISLSTIFFATKQYRDNYSGGVIKFWECFKLGLGITAVATIIYVLFWEVYFKYVAFDFPEKYVAYLTESMQSAGKTQAEISEKVAEMNKAMEEYTNNTIYRMLITATEIFPVGLIITLISSITFGKLLKRNAA